MEDSSIYYKHNERNNSNKEDSLTQEGFEISYSGLVRSFISSISKKFAKSKMNLKLKLPRPRTLAKSVDRVSDIIEFREHYHSAKRERRRKVKHVHSILHTIKASIPSFIKQSFLGTIVFTVYENSYNHLVSHTHSSPFTSDKAFPFVLMNSLFCGTLSGAITGFTSEFWDSIIRESKLLRSRYTTKSKKFHLLKSFVKGLSLQKISYILIRSQIFYFGMLFASYESLKSIIFKSSLYENVVNYKSIMTPIDDNESNEFSEINQEIKNLFDIGILFSCGGLAGLVAESLSNNNQVIVDFLKHNSSKTISELFRNRFYISHFHKRLVPSSSSLLLTTFPWSLAFLAYEFEKLEL